MFAWPYTFQVVLTVLATSTGVTLSANKQAELDKSESTSLSPTVTQSLSSLDDLKQRPAFLPHHLSAFDLHMDQIRDHLQTLQARLSYEPTAQL